MKQQVWLEFPSAKAGLQMFTSPFKSTSLRVQAICNLGLQRQALLRTEVGVKGSRNVTKERQADASSRDDVPQTNNNQDRIDKTRKTRQTIAHEA